MCSWETYTTLNLLFALGVIKIKIKKPDVILNRMLPIMVLIHMSFFYSSIPFEEMAVQKSEMKELK